MKLCTKAILCISVALLMAFMQVGCSSDVKQTDEQPVSQSESSENGEQTGPDTSESTEVKSLEGKKVLFIDSYHEGYEWADGLRKGALQKLEPAGIEMKTFAMDTIRNKGDEYIENKASEAKKFIEEYKPDAVIIADDVANKTVLQKYFKDSEIPFVSIGINWDISVYGLPYKNTAVMVEYTIDPPIIEHLKKYSKGSRIGFISSQSATCKKTAEFMPKVYGINFEKVYHVKDYNEFKEKWVAIQDEVDILYFNNRSGIEGFNDEEAEQFILNNTKIPVAAHYDWMVNFALLAICEVPQEHGEWAGETAIKILEGTKPSDIPLAKNSKGVLYINMKLADKLGITFEPSLLKNAKIIKD
ncbi:MAG: ABC transporter substrate-binding protein [Bacillota bacterium]